MRRTGFCFSLMFEGGNLLVCYLTDGASMSVFKSFRYSSSDRRAALLWNDYAHRVGSLFFYYIKKRGRGGPSFHSVTRTEGILHPHFILVTCMGS
ncbi:Uncharacterized protein APZ42_032766 [Daphnia magna]|uniref:Uncharacterized protein n=1 Tax=Daphnia magna TaxID=35525 RepID=A0A164LTX7_9CRUS|nr:Uncharacterized protein APZ42_032766 [Daphnia magna]